MDEQMNISFIKIEWNIMKERMNERIDEKYINNIIFLL